MNNTVKIIWKIIESQTEKWLSFSLNLFLKIYQRISISAILIFITLKYLSFNSYSFVYIKTDQISPKKNVYCFVYLDKSLRISSFQRSSQP